MDLTVAFGEVHALVGQNGSGKSTLIKILSGYHQPDPGSSAFFDGDDFELGSAHAAELVGLRFVHQDLGLVPKLSIVENMMLSRQYPTTLGKIHWKRVRREATERLHALGVDVDVTQPVSSLSRADQTIVAIARALHDSEGKRIIIVLDEPTAALPINDVDRLLKTITGLKATGSGVMLVSHRLNEVLQIADRISTLRDGQLVASFRRDEIDHKRLVEAILGRPFDVPEPGVDHSAQAKDVPPHLVVTRLRGGRITNFDLAVRPGEIVGVAGISGSGREALASLLTGRLDRDGEVTIGGVNVPGGKPTAALAAGMASIPGDRIQQGNFPNFSVRKNMTISNFRSIRQGVRIVKSKELREVHDWIDQLGIVTNGTEAAIGSLSGGNQQKVLVARALRLGPKVLILDDPTLGVDVGAKAQIHQIIARYAAEGMSVVVVSTDSDELASMCDEVQVFVHGRVRCTLRRGPGLTAAAIDEAQLMTWDDDTTSATAAVVNQ
ncbi:MAG: sugar ABC transporter ATP-binding protein [Acidimicrobiales bacterium]